jgi:hypothetical protein
VIASGHDPGGLGSGSVAGAVVVDDPVGFTGTGTGTGTGAAPPSDSLVALAGLGADGAAVGFGLTFGGVHRGPSPTTATGVPMSTKAKSVFTKPECTRMQPCEALLPGRGIGPWCMPMPSPVSLIQ